jgi:hypothetical protein
MKVEILQEQIEWLDAQWNGNTETPDTHAPRTSRKGLRAGNPRENKIWHEQASQYRQFRGKYC